MLGEIYNAYVSITWMLPCNTNGNLTNFSWELLEIPFEGIQNESLKGTIGPNQPITNETYGLWFSNLGARSNCSFTLTPFVDGGQISGDEVVQNFVMPDGCT